MEQESARTDPSWTFSDKLKVFLLGILFVLFSIHYYPGETARSIRETIGNIFWFAGFSGIITWSIVKVLTRIEKVQPSWPRIAKLFLILALLFGTMQQIEGCFRHRWIEVKSPLRKMSGSGLSNGQFERCSI